MLHPVATFTKLKQVENVMHEVVAKEGGAIYTQKGSWVLAYRCLRAVMLSCVGKCQEPSCTFPIAYALGTIVSFAPKTSFPFSEIPPGQISKARRRPPIMAGQPIPWRHHHVLPPRHDGGPHRASLASPNPVCRDGALPPSCAGEASVSCPSGPTTLFSTKLHAL